MRIRAVHQRDSEARAAYLGEDEGLQPSAGLLQSPLPSTPAAKLGSHPAVRSQSEGVPRE